jgi:hypothetical protein
MLSANSPSRIIPVVASMSGFLVAARKPFLLG